MEISSDLLLALTNEPEAVKSRQNRLPSIDKLDFIDKPISYEYFLENYLIPNVPCMFSNFVTSQWKSCTSWVNSDKIQWDFLNDKFGDATVPVVDCSKMTDYAQTRTDIKFSQFISHVTCRADKCEDISQLLYLKDWHFARDFPEYDAYSTPVYFTSDWLNEFWEQKTDCHDDYRFLYIGPAGTSTPFHADVFRSYSWSANVCGRKKWILYPAGDEDLLLDSRGELPSDVSEEMPTNTQKDIRTVMQTDRKADLQTDRRPRRMEVIQNPGEVIFVPSGWHHQVINLEDTISINHNWLNGCNVDICWSYIKQNLEDACETISDLRDTMDGWVEQCQLILKANVGIDFIGFYNLLDTVAGVRISFILNSQLEPDEKQNSSHEDKSNKYYKPVNINHSLFDLHRILGVLHDMLNLQTFQDTLATELSKGLNSEPQDLLNKIDIMLKSNNVNSKVR